MATKTDLAYTAGIIDGEGAICIVKHVRPNGRRTNYSLRIELSSTTKCLVDWLRTKWGGAVGYYTPQQPNYKPSWVWRLYCRQAEVVLKQVIPYLLIKKEQANLGLEFQARKHPRGASRLKTEEDYRFEVQCYLHAKGLNKRGLL